MCYYDNSNSSGITKYIKGNSMQSGNKAHANTVLRLEYT